MSFIEITVTYSHRPVGQIETNETVQLVSINTNYIASVAEVLAGPRKGQACINIGYGDECFYNADQSYEDVKALIRNAISKGKTI